MPVDQTKIILFETDVRTLKEMQNRLISYCAVHGFFEPDQVLEAVKADHNAKMVVVSTARGSDSLGLLESIRRLNSVPLRILLTGYEDLSLVVKGLHSGAVQRVMSKPLQDSELISLIRSLAQTALSGSHSNTSPR